LDINPTFNPLVAGEPNREVVVWKFFAEATGVVDLRDEELRLLGDLLTTGLGRVVTSEADFTCR